MGCSKRVGSSLLKRWAISDGVADGSRKDDRGGKTSADGSFRCRCQILAKRCQKAGHKSSHVEESRECMRTMRSLGVDVRNVEGHVADQGFCEHFRVFYIGNKRNGEVDSHSTGVIPFTGIAGWATIMVFGGQIDVQVDEIVSEVLGEGIFRLLLITTVLSKGLEILELSISFGEYDQQVCRLPCKQHYVR